MFRVTIEVWPHGDYRNPSHKSHIVACNDGAGSWDEGNYEAILARPAASKARQRDQLRRAIAAGESFRVERFPRGRDQAHLPSLVMALIEAAGLAGPYNDWRTEVTA